MLSREKVAAMTYEQKLAVHQRAVKETTALCDLLYEQAHDRGWVYNDLKLEVQANKHPLTPTWGEFCKSVLRINKSDADMYIRIVLSPDPRGEFDRYCRIAREHQEQRWRRVRMPTGEGIFKSFRAATEAERARFGEMLQASELYPYIFQWADAMERRLAIVEGFRGTKSSGKAGKRATAR